MTDSEKAPVDATVAPNCARVHPQRVSWRVKNDDTMRFPIFYGYGEVYEFVIDLEEYFMKKRIPVNHAHTYFPYVFQEKALLWYRTIGRHGQPEKGETKYEMVIKALLDAFGGHEEAEIEVHTAEAQRKEHACTVEKDAVSEVSAAAVEQKVVKPASVSRKRKMAVQEIADCVSKKMRYVSGSEGNASAEAINDENNAAMKNVHVTEENALNAAAAKGNEEGGEENRNDTAIEEINVCDKKEMDSAAGEVTGGNENDTTTEMKNGKQKQIDTAAGERNGGEGTRNSTAAKMKENGHEKKEASAEANMEEKSKNGWTIASAKCRVAAHDDDGKTAEKGNSVAKGSPPPTIRKRQRLDSENTTGQKKVSPSR